MDFSNRVVLVTGGSRGIGKSICLEFAKLGAKVVVNYQTDIAEAKGVVSRIEELGSKAIAIKCDVSKEDEVQSMVEAALAQFDQIDILINNAGIVIDCDFSQKTVAHWEKTLGTNLIGPFICSKLVGSLMQKQGHGAIVNISSTNGDNVVDPGSVEYGASKAGVSYLTRTLAKEFAPHVRVNAVAPGWVDTDMNKDLPKEYVDSEMQKIYLNRMARPDEIAKTVVFLASEDASYISGSILKVDGGYD